MVPPSHRNMIDCMCMLFFLSQDSTHRIFSLRSFLYRSKLSSQSFDLNINLSQMFLVKESLLCLKRISKIEIKGYGLQQKNIYIK